MLTDIAFKTTLVASPPDDLDITVPAGVQCQFWGNGCRN
jgi:hypothetical protein